ITGQLPPGIPARLGPQDLLHATAARSVAPRTCRRTAAGPPGERSEPGTAQTALDRAHRRQPVLSRGKRTHPDRDRSADWHAGGGAWAPSRGASPGGGWGGGRARPAAPGPHPPPRLGAFLGTAAPRRPPEALGGGARAPFIPSPPPLAGGGVPQRAPPLPRPG